MRTTWKIARWLFASLFVACLAIAAGCNSKSAAPPAEKPPSAQPAPGPESQNQASGQQTSPEVGKERDQQKQQAQTTLVPEAVSAIAETHKAVDDLAANQHDKAMADIESATGKINILLARNPSTALLPVDVQVDVIDIAPRDEKAIKALTSGVTAAIASHDLPTARVLLYDLMSEIRVRTYNLPLAAYPDALKSAARLLDQKRDDQASAELLTALNTLVIVDRTTPIPLILARAAIDSAQQERQTDKGTAQTLLKTAQNELHRCDELGYAGGDPEYAALNTEIDGLQKQLNGTSDTGSLFDRLKADLAGFINKLAGKNHR